MPSCCDLLSRRGSRPRRRLAGERRGALARTRAASACCPARWPARARGCCTRRAAARATAAARLRRRLLAWPRATTVHAGGGAGGGSRSCSCRRRTRRASALRRPPVPICAVPAPPVYPRARRRRRARRGAVAPHSPAAVASFRPMSVPKLEPVPGADERPGARARQAESVTRRREHLERPGRRIPSTGSRAPARRRSPRRCPAPPPALRPRTRG